jgi:allantoate deiminase
MSDSAVATVGQFHVHPNSINVIPGRVEMGVDVRDRDEENRDEMVNKIIDKGHAVSEIFDVDYQWDTIFQGPAVDLNQSIQDEAAEAAESLEQEYMFLNSGAGHDAMNLAQHVPAGMLFVRSQGGSSHEPSEWSTLNDCVRGARLLKKLSERLTER